MTPARLAELRRGLTAVARKVYEAVPISEAWTISQICTELGRTGARSDFSVVAGCLDSMRTQGLIREPLSGHFMRPPERSKPIPEIPTMPPPTIKPEPKKAEPDPLLIIGNVASRLRLAANSLKEAAEEIENAGLLFEARIEQAGLQDDKLRQLQALLRSLTNE